MSLRGFKRDKAATDAIYFSDARSFISLPKLIVGECTEPKAHMILFGKDKATIRIQIFRINRDCNGNNHCWKCKMIVYEYRESVAAACPNAGEWDHIRNKPGTRCDCIANARVACRHCHSERHPKPQFRQKEFA